MFFLRHFAIIFSAIGGFCCIFADDWKATLGFVIALLVNGIYLIDERIKELKKQ